MITLHDFLEMAAVADNLIYTELPVDPRWFVLKDITCAVNATWDTWNVREYTFRVKDHDESFGCVRINTKLVYIQGYMEGTTYHCIDKVHDAVLGQITKELWEYRIRQDYPMIDMYMNNEIKKKDCGVTFFTLKEGGSVEVDDTLCL